LIPTGQTGAARQEARAAIDAIGERLRNPVDKPAAAAVPPVALPGTVVRPAAIGDRVLVGAFGLEGVVKALHDREAEVDVRGKRLRARIDEIRVVAPAPQHAAPAPVRINVELQPREGTLSELNVIGCNVDEALTRAGKFLDEALLGELRTVRVIHGYGTGQLRRAIAAFLQSHPFVANFAPAPAEKGGGGVTVVDLKD
jgi:DNA mismatch repair protein MutS2